MALIGGTDEDKDNPQTLEAVEKQAIFLALERNNWKKMKTCRELGISKDTLRRKIKRYDLQRPLMELDAIEE